tara:strand:+ start:3957 stop:5027 length:1071 start_codon:yes stop_codon:yes gene_type:complete
MILKKNSLLKSIMVFVFCNLIITNSYAIKYGVIPFQPYYEYTVIRDLDTTNFPPGVPVQISEDDSLQFYNSGRLDGLVKSFQAKFEPEFEDCPIGFYCIMECKFDSIWNRPVQGFWTGTHEYSKNGFFVWRGEGGGMTSPSSMNGTYERSVTNWRYEYDCKVSLERIPSFNQKKLATEAITAPKLKLKFTGVNPAHDWGWASTKIKPGKPVITPPIPICNFEPKIIQNGQETSRLNMPTVYGFSEDSLSENASANFHIETGYRSACSGHFKLLVQNNFETYSGYHYIKTDFEPIGYIIKSDEKVLSTGSTIDAIEVNPSTIIFPDITVDYIKVGDIPDSVTNKNITGLLSFELIVQ